MILLNSKNSNKNLYIVIFNVVGFFSTICIKWNIIQYWIWKSLCFLFFELSSIYKHSQFYLQSFMNIFCSYLYFYFFIWRTSSIFAYLYSNILYLLFIWNEKKEILYKIYIYIYKIYKNLHKNLQFIIN